MFSEFDAFFFQVVSRMESNVYKGSKTDFSYFVTMTLQNRMPWKMLSSNLFNLAPTLNETKEIILILLKELETLHLILQKKHQELAKYQSSSFTAEIQISNIEHQSKTLESEITTDIRGHGKHLTPRGGHSGQKH